MCRTMTLALCLGCMTVSCGQNSDANLEAEPDPSATGRAEDPGGRDASAGGSETEGESSYACGFKEGAYSIFLNAPDADHTALPYERLRFGVVLELRESRSGWPCALRANDEWVRCAFAPDASGATVTVTSPAVLEPRVDLWTETHSFRAESVRLACDASGAFVRAETRAELNPDVQDDEGPVKLQGDVRSIALPRESVQARATLWGVEVTSDWRTDEVLSVRRVTRLRDASEVPFEFGTCTSPCTLRADFPDPGELAGEILVVELGGVFAERSRHPEQGPLALTVPRDFPRAERVICAAQFDTSDPVYPIEPKSEHLLFDARQHTNDMEGWCEEAYSGQDGPLVVGIYLE
jgi:hypothetical protein